jgi:hypothetical protein
VRQLRNNSGVAVCASAMGAAVASAASTAQAVVNAASMESGARPACNYRQPAGRAVALEFIVNMATPWHCPVLLVTTAHARLCICQTKQ